MTAPAHDTNVSYLTRLRERTDMNMLRVGLRVARVRRAATWGSGAVTQMALDAGYSKSTLHEYANVAEALHRLYGGAVRHLFSEYPTRFYSHYRTALRYAQDLEDMMDLLQAIDEGDEAYPDLILPMSVDTFAAYCEAKATGKPVTAAALFDETGEAWALVSRLTRLLRERPAKHLRIVVKET